MTAESAHLLQEFQKLQLDGRPEVELQAAREPSLLALPTCLLVSILDSLSTAANLASVASTCSALRALVSAASWQRVASYHAHCWTPGLRGSLRWSATHLPQLRDLDLSGATACSDADLLPLSQLTALTSLSLSGLWRVKGTLTCSSGTAGAGSRRRGPTVGTASPAASGGPALEVLASIVGANKGLLCLDLGGTAVPVGGGLAAALAQLLAEAPNASKAAYGLQRLRLAACPRAGGSGEDALREVLLQCPALTSLDLSGCRWATAQTLPQDGDARSIAISLLPLRQVSFAGCELLSGVGWLMASWCQLEALDLSGTAVDDADVAELADGSPWLRSLNLSGCLRIRGPALLQLATSPAVQMGHLAELRLADLAWATPQHLAPLLFELGRAAASPASLDLSGCGGLADSTLLTLLQVAPQHACSFRIQELRLANSSALTAAALLQLATERSVMLRGLRHLDVSHVQCLGSKGGSSSGSSSSAAAKALAALLQAGGTSLRRLSVDGCFVGSGLLPLLADCCPGLEALSLVGCSGAGDADMAALARLPRLRDLAVGGASLAWHEHRSLTALTGLERLRIARRPFLTDAQLAPILAANRGSLAQLELAGCAALTDRLLLHLVPGCEASQPAQQDGQPGRTEGLGHASQQQHDSAHLAAPARAVAPQLRSLQLVCCERFTGSTLRQLARLRSLRLGGCPAINEVAVQAVSVCCTQLTLLELPGHLARSCVPVAPSGTANHLHGLQVTGGKEERDSSGRGRRRNPRS